MAALETAIALLSNCHEQAIVEESLFQPLREARVRVLLEELDVQLLSAGRTAIISTLYTDLPLKPDRPGI